MVEYKVMDVGLDFEGMLNELAAQGYELVATMPSKDGSGRVVLARKIAAESNPVPDDRKNWEGEL